MKRLLCWSIFIVFLLAVPAVFAKGPPQELIAHIMQFRIVHDGKCNFHNMRGIECFIYLDQERDEIYLVFFDNQITRITHVIHVDKERKEHVLWAEPGSQT